MIFTTPGEDLYSRDGDDPAEPNRTVSNTGTPSENLIAFEI